MKTKTAAKGAALVHKSTTSMDEEASGGIKAGVVVRATREAAADEAMVATARWASKCMMLLIAPRQPATGD